PTKNDKRKTAKAVIPLRFKESLFLLCRDLASAFEVQRPHAVARIFLTGYPPILGMVYVYGNRCLQTKNPSKLQKAKSESIQSIANQPAETSFFYLADYCLYVISI
ncbi:MAG: hypothetical protein NC223_08975, partial [Butyrivibrio sp.]|nr:hypothetical protein [Butyrivibrio sp.]